MPQAYTAIFPEIPTWPFLIQCLLIPILGAYAGDEIEFKQLKHMGKNGVLFVVTSLVTPILFALPVAYGLAVWKGNPFIQE
ncbi:MAG TPA: hypothetical protein PLS49_03825, partial [Candidatus Woesebacteria bacterium]|nr:hypothetical protein [Candidatus Woesebacteria bacterium]